MTWFSSRLADEPRVEILTACFTNNCSIAFSVVAVSPMTLFAACLGAGIVGSLLTGWGVSALPAGLGAAAGAVVFNALLVRPIMRLVMGFVSEPAR